MANAKLDLLVNCSPDVAWALVGAFDSPANWHPVVASVTLSEEGDVRTMTLKNGQQVVERLTLHDDQAMSYHYQLVQSGMPIRFFSAQMQVFGNGDQSRIVWSADFDPIEGVTDAQATQAVERMLHSAGPALSARLG